MSAAPKIARKSVNNKNGLRVSYLECGPRAGELIIFIHGFPESSDSWRAQLEYFGSRGWRAVAYDQRGYLRTKGWDADDVVSFDAHNLALDCIGFMKGIGGKSAYLVAHDFGTVTATAVAQYRPDLVKALCNMAVPLGFTMPVLQDTPGDAVTKAFADLRSKGLLHYQDYLCLPETETSIMGDMKTWLAKMYALLAGDSPFLVDMAKGQLYPMAFPATENMTYRVPEDYKTPAYLTPSALEEQAALLVEGGIRGPVNYYRNTVRNRNMQQIFVGQQLQMPYCFISGKNDFCLEMYRALYDALDHLPTLKKKVLIEGAGHFVQEEKPDETNTHLEEFLEAAKAGAKAEQKSR
eukprot:TRINITY_DN4367_c0_g1_i5.p1 TRINITY_DN4367_c0_g1~~TRINITY_DN4367_c0_g1_i5.p1  ORF type:complete len:351 (+),score=150.95 TRINITY_DN4367_c0_g1_i5:56-1108(+)